MKRIDEALDRLDAEIWRVWLDLREASTDLRAVGRMRPV